MRLKAFADYLLLPYNDMGVKSIFKDYNDVIVIGNGSNIIFSESEYSSPFLCTKLLDELEFDGNSIIAGSGVRLSDLAWFALEKHISGFEFLEDIPGSVGGALSMNAGTYNDNIQNIVRSVIVYDRDSDSIIELDSSMLLPHWGKRDSYFLHHNCIIISCKFNASLSDDYLSILDKMLEIKKNRYKKQPRDYPSAGSVFKRPYLNGEPFYIWKIIDECGLRGYSIGGAQISTKHPGFIINTGNATGKDVLDLIEYIKSIVLSKYGILLEEEWRIY